MKTKFDFTFISLWSQPVSVNPLYHFTRTKINELSEYIISNKFNNTSIKLNNDEKDVLRYQKKFPCAPALLALASVVQEDYSVQIISLDVEKEKINSDNWLEEIINKICEETKFGVCISFVTPEVLQLFKFAKLIKQFNKDISIIVGGVHATVYYEDILKNSDIDIVIRGEGEATIVELFDALVNSKSLDLIKGISYRNLDKIVNNPNREHIDLSILPIPAYNLVEDFADQILLTPMFSRGCPYSCDYCVEADFWSTNVRYKNVKKFCDELEYLNKKKNRKFIHIADSTFGVHKDKLIELCDEIEKRDFDCYFSINIRPNIFEYLGDELITRLKKLNFIEMCMGVETADYDIVLALNRKQDSSKVIDTLKRLKEIGIPIVKLYLMVGSPEETRSSLENTVSFVETLIQQELIFYATSKFFVPSPGSPLFKNLSNKVEKDWDLYNRYNFPPLYKNKNCFEGEFDLYLTLIQIVQLKYYLSCVPEEYRNRISDELRDFSNKFYLKEFYY